MAESNRSWLAREVYKEQVAMFKTAWDIYIKFHTVFITVNVAALAATVQYIKPENRWPMVIAFVVQNLVSLGTAVAMSRFSRNCATRTHEAACEIVRHEAGSDSASPAELRLWSSPVPATLGSWSGIANGIGYLSLIGCWVATMFI